MAVRLRTYFYLIGALLPIGCSDGPPMWRDALLKDQVIRRSRRSWESSPPPATPAANTVVGFTVPSRPPAAAEIKPTSPSPTVVKAPSPDPAAQTSVSPRPELLAELVAQCRQSYEKIDAYSANMKKTEVSSSGKEDHQTIAVKAHRPSGRLLMEWVDTIRAGRRVAFDSSRPDSMMRVHMGAKEPKFFGDKLSIRPDSVLARANSRHPITKAGIKGWIESLEQLNANQERGDLTLGTLEVMGREQSDKVDGRWLVRIRQTVDEKSKNPTLKFGETRDWYVDEQLKLPVMVTVSDQTGRQTESYVLRDLRLNAAIAPETLVLD